MSIQKPRKKMAARTAAVAGVTFLAASILTSLAAPRPAVGYEPACYVGSGSCQTSSSCMVVAPGEIVADPTSLDSGNQPGSSCGQETKTVGVTISACGGWVQGSGCT